MVIFEIRLLGLTVESSGLCVCWRVRVYPGEDEDSMFEVSSHPETFRSEWNFPDSKIVAFDLLKHVNTLEML